MFEGQDQADMTLLGMAVSRKPCLDCAEAIRDEDVETVFVDPSKHIPKRQRAERSGSAAKQTALAEIDQAFMRQAVTPGQEATTGLEPKSSLWPALNVLNMEELYQVLLKAERDGRLKTIQSKVGRAQGVNNNRLLAPMDAIQLKRENLRANPDALTQAVVAGLLMERLALLPPDQSQYILKQLYPVLRLRTPLKSVPPKRQQQKESSKPKEPTPSEKAKESSSFVGPMMKALIAIGATAAALDALADFLLALAVDFFTKVILRIVAKGAEKAEVRKMVDEVVDKAVKEAGPKLRVLGEEVRYRVPEVLKEELNHIAEEVTRPRLAR
jgi:hypothetical protein